MNNLKNDSIMNRVKYTTPCTLYNKQMRILTFFLDRKEIFGCLVDVGRIKLCQKLMFEILPPPQ